MATTTTKSDLLIPEVMAPIVQKLLAENSPLLKVVTLDHTLVGRPGDSLTFPIGEAPTSATDVAEGAEIPIDKLSDTMVKATVKKVAKGYEVTDEAKLSGIQVQSRVAKCLADAVSQSVNKDIVTALDEATNVIESVGATTELVIAARSKMKHKNATTKRVLVMNDMDAIQLQSNAANLFRHTETGVKSYINGSFGTIWGIELISSEFVPQGSAYLVADGAIKMIDKDKMKFEEERVALRQMTRYFGVMHYVMFKFDDKKVVKVTIKPPTDAGGGGAVEGGGGGEESSP